MKKAFAVIIALAVFLSAAIPALAESDALTLEGFVKEVMEDGFIIEDTERGEVLMNVDELTVWDGVLADSPIEVGMYVFAEYDGRLTRSIPPQAHADKVGCYVLNGTAGEMLPDGILLTGDEIFGDVHVRLGADTEHVYAGVPMTVYYNGIMALSMPAQAGAAAVIVPIFEGAIEEISESGNGFTMLTDENESVSVRIDAHTIIGRPVAPVNEGIAQDEGDGADEDEGAGSKQKGIQGDWTVENEGASAYELLTPDALKPGDRVKVYYSGELAEDGAALAYEVQPAAREVEPQEE